MDELLNSLPKALLWVPVGTLMLLGVVIFIVKNLLFICRPDEILIFSGRDHTLPDGRTVGYRIVHGGRAVRIPILEKVDRLDASLMSVPMTVQGAYSKGGIPLSVQAVANVKISTDPRFVGNAAQKLLGLSRPEIVAQARDLLEGHLRQVLATMTPEEVNEDRLKFANILQEETERDLQSLGLQLDTLNIQQVSDQTNYLASLGRVRIAEILRDAEVAESDSLREAEEKEAAAQARGEIARTNASANIQRKGNELRQIKAQLEAECKSEEEKADAAALQARATAEQELQGIRTTLEELRLRAEVTIPAEVEREVRELYAAGKAATIVADGEATAQAVEAISKAWRHSGDQAMDMYVLQNLESIFAEVAQAAKRLSVEKVNLVDGGSGGTIANYAAAYPATVASLLEQVTNTLGVDLGKIMSGNNDKGTATAHKQIAG